MEKSSKLGKDILETLGFKISNNGEELATGETKTADFLVKLENENFLVEVKLKEADDDENKSREEKLSNGEVYISNGYNHTNSMLTTIMRSANRQIRSSLENISMKEKVNFSFLLFINSSYDATLRREQIINELYGKVNLIDFNDKNKAARPCYEYNHPLFKRLESNDFLLIVNFLNYTDLNGGNREAFDAIICLNQYSDKYELIKSSAIQSLNMKIIDPIEEVKNGAAYQLDKDDWEEINHILEKNGQDKIDENMERRIPLLSPRIQILSRKYQKYLIPFPMENRVQITARSTQYTSNQNSTTSEDS
ncbi:hypothetical protein [Neisseria elongata]|uniref:Uncharacterized protein n=1 Tax=Neisseria elongata subsp. nitroreducens TaxID=90367 RepID=A0A9X0ZVS2_NEIEL|nr:hypothetical protein [Neisseria elongata]MBS9340235.1 hypothetical protein [Neisseria elongata subsp. nitroreducens]